ncbi:hypothetical protein BY458DRAFT_526344 [Sporodiniella umbellata]|nr:hypothetical protein BY458DRAFT_526344 [Sporodiniella umbellata]
MYLFSLSTLFYFVRLIQALNCPVKVFFALRSYLFLNMHYKLYIIEIRYAELMLYSCCLSLSLNLLLLSFLDNTRTLSAFFLLSF